MSNKEKGKKNIEETEKAKKNEVSDDRSLS